MELYLSFLSGLLSGSCPEEKNKLYYFLILIYFSNILKNSIILLDAFYFMISFVSNADKK